MVYRCKECGKEFEKQYSLGAHVTSKHRRPSLEERFWKKVAKGEGCWLWLGGKGGDGYGLIKINDRQVMAHRVAYELVKGVIPLGLTIDHLCKNKSCVNPDHLEAVTQWENNIRGDNMTAHNLRKTHCPKGHPLEGDNLSLSELIKRNVRRCRTCKIERARNYRLRQKLVSVEALNIA